MASKVISGSSFRTEFAKPRAGAFLFYGDENLLKSRELDAIREKLLSGDSTDAFNHFVFTRDNFSHDSLMSAILAMPVMAEFKLIEIYELPFSEYRKKEDSEGFEAALSAAAESDDTVLIIYTTPENFDAGDAKTPSALMKLFSKYAVPVEFAHETTPRIAKWVQKHFSSDKIIAEPSECSYLIESVGHDMTTLEGEIEKLCAYLHYKERDRLTRVDIDYICPKNKEIGAFDFADSIIDGNSEKSFYILGDMKKKNEPALVILGGIIKIYSDLYSLRLYSDAGITSDEAAKKLGIHPYGAKTRMAKAKTLEREIIEDILKLCAETDEALKLSAAYDYLLIERLIVTAAQLRKRKI